MYLESNIPFKLKVTPLPNWPLMVQTPTKNPILWTVEDYHRMIEAGILADRQVELLNGEIIQMAPEGTPHAYFIGSMADYLRDALRGRATIREGKPITLPNDSEPEPDIAIVRPLGTVYLAHHPYPEDIFWLIEFSNSSLAKDLEDKRRIYAIAGIKEYWVVNLKTMHLIIFRDPIDDDYASKVTLADGTISSLDFPDVSIAIETLLSHAS
jgi:Uma2 family endonuclease